MAAHVKRFSLLLVLALAVHLAAESAQAKQVKYTYLKIGEGQSASAYAFKSRQACETAQRRYVAEWNRMITQMKAKIGKLGTFDPPPRTRCMDRLPFGFRRPRTGS